MSGIYDLSGMPGKVSKMDYLKLVWNVWNIRSVWNAGKSLENGLFKTGLECLEYTLCLECREKFQKWTI